MSVCGVLEATFLPGVDIGDTLATAELLCSCVTDALAFIEQNLNEDAFTQSTFEMLLLAGDLVDCFGENFADSDRLAILANVEGAEGDEIFAPEIGLTQYTALVGAVATCYFGGQCQDIFLVFEEIFTETMSKVGQELLSTIREHYMDAIFGPVKNIYGTFSNITASVTEDIDSIVKCGAEVLQTTVNDAISDFKEKTLLVQDTIDSIIVVATTMEQALESLEEILAAFDRSVIDQLVEAIKAGGKPTLVEAVEFMSNDSHIQTIQSHGTNVFEFFQSGATHLDELIDSIEVLRSELDGGAFEECVNSNMANTLNHIDELFLSADSFLDKMFSFVSNGSLGEGFASKYTPQKFDLMLG